ncbi:hypothetical protein GW17_00041031 [Ensete ventricosum]|nr:hypothetical protein GW17_00041031 [Ensete ventricosum]
MNLGTNLRDLTERANSGTNLGVAERANSGTNLRDLAKRANLGINLRDLAERANSGTNLGDLVERMNSGTNLGDLAERVNSGTNLGDFAEWVDSGTNLKDLVEKANSDTYLEDLAERANSSTNLGDLAKRANSGTNLGDLAKRANSYINLGDSACPSPGSGATSLGEPEASSLWVSSGPPSPVDARVLRDLKVMKKPQSHATYKRPSDVSIQQADDLAQRHKKVKILSRRHKSRHGKGGSRSHSKGKEPATPVEELETPVESAKEVATLVFHRPKSMKDLCGTKMALFDRVHDAGRLITFMDYHITSLQQEIDALKSRGGPEAVVVAEERASELKRSSRRQSVSDMKRSNGSKYPTKN